jgi:hypothetical protein
MPATTVKGNESELSQRERHLGEALRKADPGAVTKAYEIFHVAPEALEPHQLATAHLGSCPGNSDPKVPCKACAVSNAIAWCRRYKIDEHVRKYLGECEYTRQEIESLNIRLAEATREFVHAEAPITKMRGDRWLSGECRRRAAPLRVRYALRSLDASLRHLKEIAAALIPDDVFEDLDASVPKPGRPRDRLTNVLITVLRERMDFSGSEVAEILGTTYRAVKERGYRIPATRKSV